MILEIRKLETTRRRTSSLNSCLIQACVARAQKGRGLGWVTEGALVTRPVIPRKGLDRIESVTVITSSTTRLQWLHLKHGFVWQFSFAQTQNPLSAFPFLRIWLENVHRPKLITCPWRTGPTLTDYYGKSTALYVILPALEVFLCYLTWIMTWQTILYTTTIKSEIF